MLIIKVHQICQISQTQLLSKRTPTQYPQLSYLYSRRRRAGSARAARRGAPGLGGPAARAEGRAGGVRAAAPAEGRHAERGSRGSPRASSHRSTVRVHTHNSIILPLVNKLNARYFRTV